MCGRFAASSDAEDLMELFTIDEVAGTLPPPAYNIAPTDPIAVVIERPADTGRRRILTAMRWGLVPSWSKDARGAARLINARVETLGEKPAFRKAYAARRCLIPADGYYEWRTVERAGKPVKQPYFIHPASEAVLVMAGLYELWKQPQGGWLATATIITTAATDALGQVHDRMPLVVPTQHWSQWLDPSERSEAATLLSVPLAELEFYPVSTAVNAVANDGPELLTAITAE